MSMDYRSLALEPRCTISGVLTVEVPDVDAKQGETIPRRNWRTKDGLRSRPSEQIATVHDILSYSAQIHGENPAVGSRKFLKEHKEKKTLRKRVNGQVTEVEKEWKFFELGPYTFLNFREFKSKALNIGAGLRKLNLSTNDRILLIAATTPNWLAVAHGAMSQSMPLVTSYDTLGRKGIEHCISQTSVKIIYCDPHILPQLAESVECMKEVRHIICDTVIEPPDLEHLKLIEQKLPNVKLYTLDQLEDLGKNSPIDTVPPGEDDLCCIMFTSGSTGTPKGVMIKHKNVIAAIAGVDLVVGRYLGPSDTLLTYLPLAHILEFVFENAVLFWGGRMGYGSVRTLSDVNMRNCYGDIRELKPTALIGVPAVWETLKKGIVSKVNSSNFVVRSMFWSAMAAKNFLLSNGLPGSKILDAMVFNKVRAATGGRLRLCMNGGGPLSKDTFHFLSLSITPMISGYGLTETCGMGAIMDPLAWTVDSLGEIPGSIEIKLVDYAEAGYFTDSNPPQGEIWIRGGAVTSGYLDMKEETQEAFTPDGWFKTGDIGEFDSKGQLRIIDRKKNLVKTLNGEYIALEKLESVYRSAPVVANICVYAAASHSRPIAIIVPMEKALKELAKSVGVDSDDLSELTTNETVVGAMLKQIQNAGRQGGLTGIEIVEGIVLVDDEWTPQNGLVTPAQKLQRRVLVKKYEAGIAKAYGDSS